MARALRELPTWVAVDLLPLLVAITTTFVTVQLEVGDYVYIYAAAGLVSSLIYRS
jgi:hypothetical protein